MYLIRADKMKHDWYELGVQKIISMKIVISYCVGNCISYCFYVLFCYTNKQCLTSNCFP